MDTRLSKIIFVSMVSLACVAPGFQTLFKPFPEAQLRGVEISAEIPNVSLKTFWNGTLHDSLEKWFSSKIGFRSALIKTDNQLNYSVFHEISSSYASPMIRGKNNWVYEKLYIDAYNNRNRVGKDRVRSLALKLKDLQTALKARGILLYILLTPSKAQVYPEHIPPRFLSIRGREIPGADFNLFKKFLLRQNLDFFDSTKWMLEQKSRLPLAPPLFPRGGTHWSYQTACLVTRDFSQRIAELEAKPMQVPGCTPTRLEPYPRDFDRDLADLTNLWSAPELYPAMEYPLERAPNPSGYYRPKVLFIGGSFLWTVLHYLDVSTWYSERKFFYYFSSSFEWPSGAQRKLDFKTFDWQKEVFSQDIIVLEINEAAISRAGFGFVGRALEKLKLQPRTSGGEIAPVL